MKTKPSFNGLALFLVCALSAITLATAGALTIGDPAPELKASKWVKGGAVSGFDTDKIYVVEFWATWCGPCKAAIPHLTELAHKFPAVTFIGMDVMEKGDDTDALATKFVDGMSDKMDYHVATDAAGNFMADHWLNAAGQNGIPAAFIVRQGKVVWIGHPMKLEEPLTQAIAGTLDVDAGKQKFEECATAETKLMEFAKLAMEGGDEAQMLKLGKELEELDKQVGPLLPGGAKFDTREVLNRVKQQKAIQDPKFQAAMQAYVSAVTGGKDAADIAKLEAAARSAAAADMDFDALKKKMLEAEKGNKSVETGKP